MKKKNIMMTALAGAFVLGSAFASYAVNVGNGQWCNGNAEHPADTVWKNEKGQTVSSWWFAVSPDGNECTANTWHWIKNKDGNIQCYYFDENGWLVVDAEIDGSKVNGDGVYVDAAGKAVLGTENDTYYTASETFLGSGSGAEVQKPAQNGGGTTGHVKVDSKGEQPDETAVAFGLSAVGGSGISKTVTNEWANFTMNLNGFSSVEPGDGNSNMDFHASSEDGEISVLYYPLDQFTAGNTSFDAFLQSYVSGTGRDSAAEAGVTVKLAGEKEIGGYVFKQINRTYRIPINKTIDYCTYVRPVEGTNYAMVLYTKGSADSFASVLGTMKKVR